MHISEILAPASVLSLPHPPEKSKLLAELSRRAAAALRLDAATVTEAIAKREELGSTGMGDGIAIPHARLPTIAKPFGMLARLERPIEFAAIDGHPVDIVFLLLLSSSSTSSSTSSGAQLAALACVTRQLRNPAVAEAIRRAASVEAVHRAMLA